MAQQIRVIHDFDVWLVPGMVERHYPAGYEGYEIEKVVEAGLAAGAIEVIKDGRVPRARQGSGDIPQNTAGDEGAPVKGA